MNKLKAIWKIIKGRPTIYGCNLRRLHFQSGCDAYVIQTKIEEKDCAVDCLIYIDGATNFHIGKDVEISNKHNMPEPIDTFIKRH